jgi:hypothetical protein
MNGTKVEADPPLTYLGNDGRITIIGNEPLIDAYLDANRQRQLILYGRQGAIYNVQYVTNALDTNWTLRSRITMTNLFRPLAPGATPAAPVYYRARN